MQGLYAIVDPEALSRAGMEILPFADAVLSAGPAALQLRDKRRDSRATLALLRELGPRCRRAGVPLFANDRADLALLAECDGLHVGHRDLPPHAVRALAEGRAPLRIGMSVHNEEELAIALAEEPDYIALGPVFATHNKLNPDPVIGLGGLAALATLAREGGADTLVAIGGIDGERVREVAPHCEMTAVIGALIDGTAPDPYAAAADRARHLAAVIAERNTAR